MTARTRAEHIIERATAKGMTVSVAESCTGGLISAALTDVPGASAVFTHGLVAYANAAKTGVLGVAPSLIEQHGAVSGEVAGAMAEGARRLSGADIAVSVTGIAGPGGGSADKPVGLVWLGVATKDGARSERKMFDDQGRNAVRQEAVLAALALIEDALDRHGA